MYLLLYSFIARFHRLFYPFFSHQSPVSRCILGRWHHGERRTRGEGQNGGRGEYGVAAVASLRDHGGATPASDFHAHGGAALATGPRDHDGAAPAADLPAHGGAAPAAGPHDHGGAATAAGLHAHGRPLHPRRSSARGRPCDHGGAAPAAGLYAHGRPARRAAPMPAAGLHAEDLVGGRPTTPSPLPHQRNDREEKEVALKQRKASVRVSRHFQRFGNRADSFRAHETFFFSPISVSCKNSSFADVTLYLMCMKSSIKRH